MQVADTLGLSTRAQLRVHTPRVVLPPQARRYSWLMEELGVNYTFDIVADYTNASAVLSLLEAVRPPCTPWLATCCRQVPVFVSLCFFGEPLLDSACACSLQADGRQLPQLCMG